jgi:DNA repair exonuclease SbcCD nuclease subunit
MVIFLVPDNKPTGEDLSPKKEQPALKIGFITDPHCYSKFDKGLGEWELNWRCTQPLTAFVDKMNNDFHPDFVIEDGDFIDGVDDRSFKTFLEADKIFSQIDAPYYHVLGNHETRSFEKKVWLEDLVNYEKPYYSFDVRNYRIIVLDGNNRLYPNGEVKPTTPENHHYPGALEEKQWNWLTDLLEQSGKYELIVFVHQPPINTDVKPNGQLFQQGDKLRSLFSKHKVRAVFSGHIERFCDIEEEGVKYFVLQGFWKANGGLKKEFRYSKGGVFSEVTITDDNIEVKAFHNKGRDTTYEMLELTPENSNCTDGHTLIQD